MASNCYLTAVKTIPEAFKNGGVDCPFAVARKHDNCLPSFGGDFLFMMKVGTGLTLSRSYKDALRDFE